MTSSEYRELKEYRETMKRLNKQASENYEKLRKGEITLDQVFKHNKIRSALSLRLSQYEMLLQAAVFKQAEDCFRIAIASSLTSSARLTLDTKPPEDEIIEGFPDYNPDVSQMVVNIRTEAIRIAQIIIEKRLNG